MQPPLNSITPTSNKSKTKTSSTTTTPTTTKPSNESSNKSKTQTSSTTTTPTTTKPSNESSNESKTKTSGSGRRATTGSRTTRSTRRRASLHIGLGAQRLSLADFRGHLDPATAKEESKRPGRDEEQPTDIFFFVLFKKIRNIDVIKASISIRFILSLQWGAPHLMRKHVNVKNLWTPKISFLNNDMLVEQKSEPTFFPETGEIKQIIVMDGNMSNEMSLKYFPWDFDDVNLLLVADMDTFDRNVRLFWQESRKIESVTPEFLNNQLTEWNLDAEYNSLGRLPEIPGGVLGNYNGIVLKYYMERVEGFYLIKILSIIAMLTAMSWCTMMIYELEEVQLSNGTFTGETVRTVSVTSFTDRINLSCAVLLACVAFQYLISDNLPKTGYMTTMDSLLMTSFVTIFAGALETTICRSYSAVGQHSVAEALDSWCLIIIPVCFGVSWFIYIFTAIMKRRSDRWHAANSPSIGVCESLLISHMDKVKEVVSEEGWKQSHSRSNIHLIEDNIDDVNVVDDFEKEIKQHNPKIILDEDLGNHNHPGRSRSLFSDDAITMYDEKNTGKAVSSMGRVRSLINIAVSKRSSTHGKQGAKFGPPTKLS